MTQRELFHRLPSKYVKEYQDTSGQVPDVLLYEKLIFEEYTEWLNTEDEDGVGELKELADLVYVIYGYANAMGWDLDEALFRVHENNMGRMYQETKCGECSGTGLSRVGMVEGMSSYCIACNGTGGHRFIERRDDGKIIKNKDYPPVRLKDLV